MTSTFQFLRFLAQNASYQNAEAVTPSNTEDLARTVSALYIGGTGTLKVDMEGIGEGITFTAVPVGLFKARVTKVYQTGTSATNIISMW